MYGLRRSAVATVVALCSSKRNQARLLQDHSEANSRLMRHTLPHCGDVDTQVWYCGWVCSTGSTRVWSGSGLCQRVRTSNAADATAAPDAVAREYHIASVSCLLLPLQIDCMELMYRCAKNHNEKVYHSHLDPHVSAHLLTMN